MSISSNVSLGFLRTQAKRRADMENNPFVSDIEWNDYLTSAYKELYDKLVSAYGNEYYMATQYQFSTNNSQSYGLPDGTANFFDTSGSVSAKVYKVLGVDLQYSGSPSGFVTLKRFEFIERNKYAYPNTTTNYAGYTNLRYRIQGNNLFVIPVPQTGQTVQLWYVPAPTNLQYTIPITVTGINNICSVTDATGLTVGMSMVGTDSSVRTGLTVNAINSASITASGTINFTSSSQPYLVSFYDDSNTFDGIAGWEEFVILKAAIIAKTKQEDDITALALQLKEVSDRIDAMAEGRDIGQAQHVSDVLGANPWSGCGDDGGWGGGWG